MQIVLLVLSQFHTHIKWMRTVDDNLVFMRNLNSNVQGSD